MGVPTTLQHDKKSQLEDAVGALHNGLTQQPSDTERAPLYKHLSNVTNRDWGPIKEVLFNDNVYE